MSDNTGPGLNSQRSVIDRPAAGLLKLFTVFPGSAFGLFKFFVLSSISKMCNKPSFSLLKMQISFEVF